MVQRARISTVYNLTPGIRVRDALNLRRCLYEEVMREEPDDAQWDKIVKEVEKHYTKDCKTELERYRTYLNVK